MDVAGEHQADVEHSIYKTQLAPDGTELNHEKTERMLANQFISRVSRMCCISILLFQSPNAVQ